LRLRKYNTADFSEANLAAISSTQLTEQPLNPKTKSMAYQAAIPALKLPKTIAPVKPPRAG
jgi:hypothetical protein